MWFYRDRYDRWCRLSGCRYTITVTFGSVELGEGVGEFLGEVKGFGEVVAEHIYHK